MKVKYRVVFNRKKRLNKENKASVHIEAYWNRKTIIYIPTHVFIHESDWDKRNNRISSRHPNYIELNNNIRRKIDNIEKFELSQINYDKPFTPEILQEFLNNNYQKLDFISFYQLELEKSAGPKSTKACWKTTLTRLKEFKNRIDFNEINYELIYNFDVYLKHKNLKVNSIINHHKRFKKFLKIAINKGYFEEKNNPYKNFKLRQESSGRVSLTMEEVKKIEKVELPDSGELIAVKDMFLFSCYCGLRYSDIQNLQHEHLEITKEDICVKLDQMVKTKEPILLPLNYLFQGKPQVIINKYIDKKNEGYIFPRITNQAMNRLLKVIQLSAGIKKKLTCHIGRHTFGTMIADIFGNPFIIQKLMGHNDIDTSMIYIHNSQEVINKQLKEGNWKLIMD